jgi:hypothetical protein
MSDLDARLDAALREDLPPERDAVFRIGVLVRRERTRFKRRLALAIAVSFLTAGLAAVGTQSILTWVNADVRRLWIVAAIAATAIIALPGVPISSTPGLRSLVHIFRRWFPT